MIRRPTWVRVLALVAGTAICTLGAVRRLRVAGEYLNFAGDGWQYFHLAEQLVKDHRYAFAPLPVPLANSRLPGYPLFIAAIGWPVKHFVAAEVGARVVHVQAILDVLTALFAFLIAREIGLRVPKWLGLALCLGSPFLAACTSYVLSETIAIFFTTVTLWLLARACRDRLRLHLALAGGLIAAGMLIRIDAITLAPCLAIPLFFSCSSRREKAIAALISITTAATVFAPWPLRNLVRFHSPHAIGSSWVSKQGDPLPTGVQSWLRTWAIDPQQAKEIAWTITRADPVFPVTLPMEAADSPEERARLSKLFDDYNRFDQLTPSVDAKFTTLANERRLRDRWRYYVALPLRRAKLLWFDPVPDWELPINSTTLHLPELRDRWGALNHRTLVLALLGWLLLCLIPSGRPLAALALLAALGRTVAVIFAVPGGTQRYLFELLPLVLVLAATALCAPAELILRRLRREPSP